MKKMYAYNILLDFVEFLKANRVKFVITVIIFLCGIGVGIASALNVSNVNNYLFTHNSNTFILITGKKSAFGYFFVRLITVALLALLIVLFSFNFYLAFVGYLLLFFFVFIFSMYFTLYVMFFHATVFPLIFLCLAPCMIIIFFILSVLVVLGINRGREITAYGCYNKVAFISFMRVCLPVFASLIAIIMIESILAFIFTMAIAI